MKLQLIIFYFLILISFTIQGPDYECNSIEEPSKDQWYSLFLEKTKCCFLEHISPSEPSECFEYDPDLINDDYYIADHFKDVKYGVIFSYIKKHDGKDLDSLEMNQIINELENSLKEKFKIECNSFTKEIDYSTIKYTEDDIERAKQDNFCGKLMNAESEVNEGQCLAGIVFSELEAIGEKCCYSEVFQKKLVIRKLHAYLYL